MKPRRLLSHSQNRLPNSTQFDALLALERNWRSPTAIRDKNFTIIVSSCMQLRPSPTETANANCSEDINPTKLQTQICVCIVAERISHFAFHISNSWKLQISTLRFMLSCVGRYDGGRKRRESE